MARIKNCVPEPTARIPTDEEVWNEDGTPNISFLRNHFFQEGKLTTDQVTKLCKEANQLMRGEKNLLQLTTPITVCGDIHGQYYDLMKLFEMAGTIESFLSDPTLQILFLGDYVDRGYYSIECYLLLLALKIKCPKQIWLLRGNHECRHLTAYFTFKKECKYKYNEAVYELLCQSFDHLPIAAVVDKKFFCVHGGISPSLGMVEEINEIDRFMDPPRKSLFCDLLWSDPHESYGQEGGKALFTPNRVRGCSYSYTYAGVLEFLNRNGLLSIVRGHEAQENGYKLYRKGEKTGFPTVVTLFSAPNYVDTYKNKAAILRFDGKLFFIKQFSHSPHPYWLPNFMDGLTWSSGFVAEKIVEILLALLNLASSTERLPESMLSMEERSLVREDTERRTRRLTEQLKLFGKLQHKLAQLRFKKEALCELAMSPASSPSHPAPEVAENHLDVVSDDTRAQIETFAEARYSDLVNERLPPTDKESASMHPDPSYIPPIPQGPPEVTVAPDYVITESELEKTN